MATILFWYGYLKTAVSNLCPTGQNRSSITLTRTRKIIGVLYLSAHGRYFHIINFSRTALRDHACHITQVFFSKPNTNMKEGKADYLFNMYKILSSRASFQAVCFTLGYQNNTSCGLQWEQKSPTKVMASKTIFSRPYPCYFLLLCPLYIRPKSHSMSARR